jgi:Asp-tRNA(Asn)/Glu-tRNA(Gln) amidotransferase A subunit family amidase
MVPLALGTDGGGSIRIPASFCGIVGHKPTFGLVPKLPGFRGWPTLSVDGPLGRSVGEVAAMLAVMAGAAPADDLTWPVAAGDATAAAARAAVPGGVVAYSADLGFAPVEPDVRAAFERALGVLSDAGWHLEEAAPPTGDPTALWNAIACAEGYASEGPLLAEWEDRMTEGTAEIVRAGEGVTAAQYLDAQHERAAFTRVWAEFFERYELLLTPSMQMTAFPVGILAPATIDGRPVDPFFDDWVTFCLPANLTGQPASSVPIGLGDGGLPIGLHIVGPRWADAAVLGAAAAVEVVLPG